MEIFMSIVGAIMVLSGAPQITKMLKRKSSADVSIITWTTIFFGQGCWVYYGFINDIISIIITNSLGMLVNFIIIFVSLYYRRNCNPAIAKLQD